MLLFRQFHMDISQQLRRTMKKVPSPVIVVTCNAGKSIKGITCSSYNSISLNPPIISFALKLPSSTREMLIGSSKYAVHILSSQQTKQSMNFASPKTQGDFSGFPFYLDSNGLPILQGCLSVLECSLDQRQIVGDHEVWYSKVLQVTDGYQKSEKGFEALKPLLYYDSSYRSIGDQVFIQAFENVSLSFDEWTHRAHLRMAWIYLSNEYRDANATGEASATVEAQTKAFTNIKSGILQYNQANAHLLSNGFNESITRFFCVLVDLALKRDQSLGLIGSDFLDFLERYPYLDRFPFIFEYYSKNVLYSEEAKQR